MNRENGNLHPDVAAFAKKRRKRKAWKKVVTAMSAVVVFVTTYALIIPAITMNSDTSCGKEEHVHSESCYVGIASGVEGGELICTADNENVHVHGDECYGPAEGGHIHDENCYEYALGELICLLPEGEGHSHVEKCWIPGTEPVCGIPEGHIHDQYCFSEDVLVCPIPENHVHVSECCGYVLDCGLEEYEAHTHSDECYEKIATLICTLEESEGEKVLLCEEVVSEHIHGDECYEARELICEKEEHTHDLACYANHEADRETAEQWEASFRGAELSGNWARDVLAIAETQLGYRESQLNYIVSEDGAVRGYTRYGDWYGEGYDYGDWCAMFASFCLHYSGVGEAYPTNAYCPFWVNELTELGYYKIPYEYVPKSGDLIFFDWEQDGIVDHVGFVEAVEGTMVYTIEGNSNASVERREYELFDKRIDGYGELVQSNAPIGEVDKDSTNAWVELIEEADEAIYGLSEEVLPQEAGVEQGAPMMRSGGATYGLSRGLFGARALGAPLDLTPYINAVTMYDANGNLLPSGSMVTEGDIIEFKLEYTITGQQLAVMNGEDLSVKTDTLTYSLPEIFEMVRSDSGNIVNSSGQTVGTYVIDSETETITMTFSEDYLRQNAKGIQIHGFISFFSTVTKITEEEGEHQDFKFTDKIVLGVNIEEKHEAVGDLTIQKSKMSVDGEYITYELVVTSAEGTSGPITITDKMSAGLSFVEGISVRRGNGSSINAIFNAAADKGSFTMTLPEMKAGDSYVIRYRCKADIDLLGADLTVRNTASVSGKDSDGKDLKDETFVNHTFTALKKTGVANDDGTITWTITINQDKLDISGWTLEDILTTDKGASSYRGPVTIKNSAGNVVAQNVTLPYTFPAGSKDTYVIAYTTSHDYADGVYISNKAILKDDDTDITVVTGTNIGQPTAKSGEAGEVTQVDGKYVLPITWTVTIDTSIGEIPAGEVLIDTMEDWNSNEMYMTYSQLMSAYNNIKAALEDAGSSISQFTAKEYAYEMGQATNRKYSLSELSEDKLYEYFEVTLGKAIPKEKLITFTYETSGIFENNVLAGSVYTNQFNISGRYNIKSNVYFTAGTIKAKKMALSYYDPYNPYNGDWLWNYYHYDGTDGVTELQYEKLIDDYLAWTIELSAPLEFLGTGNIILYEDLPDGVEIRGLTLPFRDGIPARTTLELWDIEPGKSYEWTFDLYTAEQYLNWSFWQKAPVPTIITINVTESGDVEMIMPGIIFETMAQFATLYNEANKELFESDPENYKPLDEWYGYLHIFTQIDEDFEWTEETKKDKVYVHNFENRFTIEDEDGKVLDYGSQTQRIYKDESSGVIRKKASTDENNIITYSVILNAYGRDLIENSDALAIHDELSYPSTDAKPLRVRLVPGSVKLYEIDLKSDGKYTKLSEIPINYRYNESSTEAGGVTNWLHTLDLTIPDGKSLVLEYSYKASGVKGSDHNVLNECTITGVGEGDLEGNVKVEIEVKEAAAQANIKGVMLYKVDANSDGIFLENALFNIYIWNEEQGKYIIVHHPENGDTEFTTDVTGAIILDNSTIDEAQFAYNTAYYIVEVESPNGYYLSPEPYYFYIAHENTEAYPGCFPEGFTGHALTSGDIIYRQNVSEFTEIKVEKFWLDFVG
ncbi:MAG: CHAP domain-containing protein, partial [Oscillospiraceae bacterium]|nr:CHAP domain-containing protein [Oscillospiraceae bacterium]